MSNSERVQRVVSSTVIPPPLSAPPPPPPPPSGRISPECSTSQPVVHAACDGCDHACHDEIADATRLVAELVAHGAKDVEYRGHGFIIRHEPRRRWWHRFTRRATKETT